jgi:hypothetical protein
VIVDCGLDSGQPVDPAVCARIKAAHWVVNDRFTVGSVGKHVDFYIGEETGSGFTSSPWYFTGNDATVRFE